MKSEKVKIKSGVPIPKLNGGNTRSLKKRAPAYPFDKMKVGDSFLTKKKIKNILGQAKHWAKVMKKKREWTCRTVKGGTRIWRVT